MKIHAVSLPFIAVRGVLGVRELEIWDTRLMRLAEANRSLVRACKSEARRLAAETEAEKKEAARSRAESDLLP